MNNNSQYCLLPRMTMLLLPTKKQILQTKLLQHKEAIKQKDACLQNLKTMIGLLQNKQTKIRTESRAIKIQYCKDDFELSKLDGRYKVVQRTKKTRGVKSTISKLSQSDILKLAETLKAL